MREKDVEINRLVVLIEELKQWKVKYEMSSVEISKLKYRCGELSDNLRITSESYEKRILELDVQLREFQSRYQKLEYEMTRYREENVSLKFSIQFLRVEIGRQSRRLAEMELMHEQVSN